MLKTFIVCVLASLVLMGCGRDRGVYAGNESPKNHDPTEIKGTLLRADLAGKTIGVQIENGLEQTFKFDNTTGLRGLESQPPTAISSSSLGSLVGKEGSEVTVHWRGDNDAKLATQVEVTQVSIARHPRHRSRRLVNRG